MKNYLLLVSFVFGSFLVQGQYCTPSDMTCGDYIDVVSFSNVVNPSDSADCADNYGYTFYNQDTVFVVPGKTYNVGWTNKTYSDAIGAVWIDFDMSGEFEVTDKNIAQSGMRAHQVSIEVPTSFAVGSVTRARFGVYIAGAPEMDACGFAALYYPYEFEDYVIKAVDTIPGGPTYCFSRGSGMSPDCNDNNNAATTAYIERVEWSNGFDNNSATCGVTSSGYSDYTNLVEYLSDGDDFDFTTTIFSGGNFANVSAWVDFNGDGTFDPVTEEITTTGAQGDLQWEFSGTVASNGFSGLTRMRVLCWWNFIDYVATPCAVSSVGEVEDYSIFIVSPNSPDCAENPTPSEGATSVCLSDVELTWTHPDAANVDGYKLSLGTTSGGAEIEDATDLGNVLSFTPSNLQPNTTYYWTVTPYSGADDAVACSEWSFTTAINPDPKPQFFVGGNLVTDTSTCLDSPMEIKVVMENGDGTIQGGSWNQDMGNGLSIIGNDSAVFESSQADVFTIYHTIEDVNGCTGIDSLKITVNPSPDAGMISPEIQSFCGSGQETFTLSGATGTVQWEDSIPGGLWTEISGETENTVEVSATAAGTTVERYVRAVVTENGCSAISDFSGMVVNPNPEKAGISFPEGLEFCSGDSVTLASEMVSDSLVWLPSEADGAADLIVKTAGDVTLRRVDRLTTCFSDSTLTITEEALPVKPIMDPSTDQTICSVDLPFEVSITNPTSAVEWMTGETTTTIAINNIAEEVFVSNITDKGCKSTSDTIRIDVIAQPSKPEIEIPSGSAEFCDGDSLLVRISNFSSGIIWSDGSEDIQRYIKAGGTYTATFGSGTSCEATSDPITVSMLESPDPIVLNVVGPNPGCVGDSVYLIATNYPEVSWNNSTNTINDTLLVTTSGNYRATVEGSNGCTRSATEEVVLDPIPEAPVITIFGDGDCPGDEKILVANTDVLWNDAAETFNDSLIVTNPGTYTATVSNGICANESSVEVVYDGAPENPEISQSNDTLFVTPADQESYSWYKDEELIATTTEPFLDGVEPGVYAVTYATSGGCTSALSENFIVIGINELNGEQVLVLFPNPGQGTYFLNVDAQEIKVFDALGRTVESELTKDRKLIIPDAKGHLFLQVLIGEKIYHSRLIQE